jgi:hypothetical protein
MRGKYEVLWPGHVNAMNQSDSLLSRIIILRYNNKKCWSFSLTIVLFVCLFNYCFTSRSRFFNLYGDLTITGDELQILSLCSALRAFEQGGIFIVPYLL